MIEGAIDSRVDVPTGQAWLGFRTAREEERMWEAYQPQRIAERFRIEQSWIDNGCISDAELIGLGRSMFLRQWSVEEGLGNDLSGIDPLAGQKPRPNFRRFQAGAFGGPDANACVNCHWKGGFAGAGDRADNSFLFGDGDDALVHDQRNPPALWGAGWIQIIADEMTGELRETYDTAIARVQASGEPERVELYAKDVYFGVVEISVDEQGDPVSDFTGLEGVDADLVVKPFGWKGNFTDLRTFVKDSFHVHMNLQAEELVRTPDEFLHLGRGDNPDDPDNDGVLRELTEGQITAMVAFIATLDTPEIQVPTIAGQYGNPLLGDFEAVYGSEFIDRWLEGVDVFDELGCSYCHRPFMAVSSSIWRSKGLSEGSTHIELDLAMHGAAPKPELNNDGVWLVPVFSDFKRHQMGSHLEAQHVDRDVPTSDYMTRRLWGVANTKPYMHTGSATTFGEAIALHGGEGSEAQPMAQAFFELDMGRRASLMVFLDSLRRAPAIRVR